MNKKDTRYNPIVLFFILGVCYNYFPLLFTLPDEEGHFAYGEYISQKKMLRRKRSSEGSSVRYGIPSYLVLPDMLAFSPDDQRLLKEEISVNDGSGYRRVRVVVFP